MAVIWVAPADRLDAILREHAPSHVVLIASPDGRGSNTVIGSEAKQPRGETQRPVGCFVAAAPRNDGRREQHLHFHDIDAPRDGLVAPSAADIERLLAAARSWDGTRPLAVACALGISRSPAAAFAIACAARPEIAEAEIAAGLRAASPCATPNRLLVALADAALGREGRMIAAVAALGRGADYVSQAGFALRLPPVGA